MRVIIDGCLRVDKRDFSKKFIVRLKNRLTFHSKSGDEVYAYVEEGKNTILAPRGYLEYIKEYKGLEIIDERTDVRTEFRYTRDPKCQLVNFQKKACDSVEKDLLKKQWGILVGRTAAGKTVMACNLVARLGRKTLVLVDQRNLIKQWVDRIKRFLPGADVVEYYGNKRKGWLRADIVVATLQTVTKGVSKLFKKAFGLVIVDEVHILSAPSFTRAISQVDAKFRLGLTATPYRSDGLEEIFYLHIGPIIYTIARREVESAGIATNPHVYVRETRFKAVRKPPVGSNVLRIPMKWWWNNWEENYEWVVNHSKLTTLYCMSKEHNLSIFSEIRKAYDSGRKVLVISDRNDQLKWLLRKCKRRGIDAAIVIGEIKDVDREKAFSSQIIFSNFKITQKGLDVPDLDVLMYASLRKDRTSVEQSAGRVSRNFLSKKKPIIVIFEPNCSVLSRYVIAMLRVLKKLGCVIKSA